MTVVVRLKDILTKELMSLEKTELVINAIKFMAEKGIWTVVVTDKGKPAGILTERDIVKMFCSQKLSPTMTVAEIMSNPIMTMEADTKLGEAAILMAEKGISRLLVVENGKIVGIVTQKEIMHRIVEAFRAHGII